MIEMIAGFELDQFPLPVMGSVELSENVAVAVNPITCWTVADGFCGVIAILERLTVVAVPSEAVPCTCAVPLTVVLVWPQALNAKKSMKIARRTAIYLTIY